MNPSANFILGSLSNVYMMDTFCFIVALPTFILVIAPSLPLTMSLLSLQSLGVQIIAGHRNVPVFLLCLVLVMDI